MRRGWRQGCYPRSAAWLRRWAGFVKLSHTVFALPFAVASMAVAARDHARLAGLADVPAHSGGDVLRADLRDVVQPDRGPGI